MLSSTSSLRLFAFLTEQLMLPWVLVVGWPHLGQPVPGVLFCLGAQFREVSTGHCAVHLAQHTGTFRRLLARAVTFSRGGECYKALTLNLGLCDY